MFTTLLDDPRGADTLAIDMVGGGSEMPGAMVAVPMLLMSVVPTGLERTSVKFLTALTDLSTTGTVIPNVDCPGWKVRSPDSLV